MIIYKSILEKTRFEKDFMTQLSRKISKEDRLDTVNKIIELSNSVGGNIHEFLRVLDTVEDRKIKMYSRCAAVAQLFNVNIENVEYSAYSELVFLCYQQSTAVISKYGEIIIGEGRIKLNPRVNRGLGFSVRSLENGLWGFISNTGKQLLPCLFEEIRLHMGECNPIYSSGVYNMRAMGSLAAIEKGDLEDVIEDYDDYCYCLAEDDILIEIREWSQEQPYHRGDINKIKEVMSDMIVSKERLQEALN